jgi:large repetitive protein
MAHFYANAYIQKTLVRLIFILLITFSFHSNSQIPFLTSANPGINNTNISRAATINQGYNTPVNALPASNANSAINQNNFYIHSNKRGRIGNGLGLYSFPGTSTARFTPTNLLLPGEKIYCSRTENVIANNGNQANTRQTHSFTVNASTAPASFFTQIGTGSLPAATLIETVSADFDNDGNLDMMVLFNDRVVLRRGNGLGGFITNTTTNLGSNTATGITLLDFNNDGFMDFAVSYNNTTGTTLRVQAYVNNTNSTFTAAGGFTANGLTTPVGLGMTAITSGDVDGDGDMDIVLGLVGRIWLVRNTGTAFQNGGIMTALSDDAAEVLKILEGDYNRDFVMDFAVFHRNLNLSPKINADIIRSFSNLLAITYDALNIPTPSTNNNQPSDFVASDFNGDNNLDLAWASNSRLYLLTNTTSITSQQYLFTTSNVTFSGSQCSDLAVGDIDGDGDLDILMARVVGNGDFNFFRNDGGTFTNVNNSNTFSHGSFDPQKITEGDFDNDGDIDFGAVRTTFSENYAILRNQQSISLPKLVSSYCAGTTFGITYSAGAGGTYNSGNVFTIQLSNSSGSFVSPVNIGTLSSTNLTGVIVVTIPVGTAQGSGYRIRVVASNPSAIGNPSFTSFTVNSLVDYTLSSSTNNICASGVATLNLSGSTAGINYRLNRNGIPVDSAFGQGSPLSFTTNIAGTYTVTAVNTNNFCERQMTGSVVVNVTALPVISLSNRSCSSGTSTTLIASGASTYTWSPSTGLNTTVSASVIATPTAPQVYTVTGTTNGCSSSANVSVSNQCYCVGNYNFGCVEGDLIDRVQVGSINNVGSGCSNNLQSYTAYSNTAGFTTTFQAGSSYPMSLQAGTAFSQGFGVWIDFNRDGDFDDAGEFLNFPSTPSTTIQNGTISIPAAINPGLTTMRVRAIYNAVPSASDACTLFNYGETEDYLVTLVEPLVVLSTNPARHTSDAALATNTTVTFNKNIATVGVTRIHGNGKGLHFFSSSTPQPSRLYNPNIDYKPGEKIFFNIQGVTATDGSNLAIPYQFEYTAAAGSGTARFQALNSIASNNISDIVAGDFDLDGDIDYAVSRSPSELEWNAQVYFNNGSGTFTAGTGNNRFSFGTVNAFASGDLDNDGDLDMVFAVPFAANTMRFLRNDLGGINGAGSFSGLITSWTTEAATRIAVADVTGDGNLDIVCSNSTTGRLFYYVNNGSGALNTRFSSTPVTIQDLSGMSAFVVGDFNNDGLLDVVSGRTSSGFLRIHLNTPASPGTFQTPLSINPGGTSTGLENLKAVDYDGDGDLDIIATKGSDQTLVFLRNNFPTQSFTIISTLTTAGTPNRIEVADFDGDGDMDVYVANVSANAQYFINNNGNFSLTTNATGGSPSIIASADFDGDGDIDIVGQNLFAALAQPINFIENREYTVTASAITNPVCAGSFMSVGRTLSPTTWPSTTFTAELSNASGSFASPTVLGSLTTTVGFSSSFLIPASTPAGTGYRVRWVNNLTGSTVVQSGTFTINTINLFNVSGGDTICSGSTSTVTLSGSNSGVRYRLLRNGSPVDSTNGTGGVLNFTVSLAGTYTINATNLTTLCSRDMNNSVSVTVLALPNAFNVSGGGSYCAGGSGVSIFLSASNNNINYELLLNGNPTGNIIAGTGSSLTYPGILAAGTYTIRATNNSTGCQRLMNFSATVTVTPTVTTSVALSASANPACSGSNVTFTATPTNGGTPTYFWYVNNVDANVSSSSNTFTTNTLNNGDVVRVDMFSSVPCSSPSPATASVTMNITPTVTPSVSITGPVSVCSGQPVTYTASAVNGGTSTNYEWRLGTFLPIIVQSGPSNTYTSTFSSNTAIRCIITSNATCASPTTATSNIINISVTPTVTPSVTISTSTSFACQGEQITFFSNVVNGGTTPQYQWKVNNVNVSGATSSSFSTTSLNNLDAVTLEITSNANCASPTTATSSAVIVTINPNLTPTITIAPDNNPICNNDGASATFTATITNEGSEPEIFWYVNGNLEASGFGNTTFSFLFSDGDEVTAELSSNALCANPSSVGSNAVTMTVNTAATPIITEIVPGVTLQSSPAVTYQWYLNGNPISGATSQTYNYSSVGNYSVEISDANGCFALSNDFSVGVPTITVGNVTGPICAGSTFNLNYTVSSPFLIGNTFTAQLSSATGLFLFPVTIGSVNATGNGSISVTIPPGTPNGNGYRIRITSSNPASTSVPGNSFTINQVVPASVTISSSPSGAQCAGTNITFTATPTNGGPLPLYQWRVNGVDVPGATASTFTTSTLSNGSTVSVVMTSSLPCVSGSPATSNTITQSINPLVTPTVAISGDNSICNGETVVFSSVITNGGSTPLYQWRVNGVDVSGATLSTFSTSSLNNNDVVSVQLTSNANCASPTQVLSNGITMTVTPLPISFSLSGGGFLCTGSSTLPLTLNGSEVGVNYQLFLNNNPIGSAISGTGNNLIFTASLAGNYTVEATTTVNGCLNEMNGTAVVNNSPTPVQVGLLNSTNLCLGQSEPISTDNSEVGFSYQLLYGPSPIGAPLAGTGSPLNFGLFSGAGDYSVNIINNLSGCVTNYGNTITFTVNSLPTVYQLTGDAGYCTGSDGAMLELSGSDVNVNYIVFINNVFNGIFAGTGDPLELGPFAQQGNFTVTAESSITGCQQAMNGTVAVSQFNSPSALNFNFIGDLCPGNTVEFTIDNTEIDVNYELSLDGSNSGNIQAGNGGSLSFTISTPNIYYLIIGTSAINGCEAIVADQFVSEGNNANVYNVIGGGTICQGEPDLPVGLDNSEDPDSGIQYFVLRNDTIIDGPFFGNNGLIIFDTYSTSGTYTVLAVSSSNCETQMSGNAVINVLPAIPDANAGVDQSICNDNTFLAGNNPGPGNTGTWTIYSGIGTIANINDPNTQVTGIGLGFNGFIWTISNGICAPKADTVPVFRNSLPLVYDLSGGGLFCEGENGVSVSLLNSDLNVDYTLLVNNLPAATLPGVNGILNFGLQTISGNYTAIAIDQNTGCSNTMNGVTVVNEISLPPAPVLSIVDNCGNSTITATNLVGILNWSDSGSGNPRTVNGGTFTATQTVSGCTGPASNAVTSNPLTVPPAPVLSVIDNCGSSTISASGIIGALQWNDGSTVNPRTVSGGSYTAIQTLGTCTSSVSNSITANPLVIPVTPVINGTANPLCFANEVYAVDLTAGSSYAWTVPSGATITSGASGPENNQIVVNFSSSNGTITVTETNSDGCTGNTESLAITLQGCGVTIDFEADNTSICQGQSVTFTNLTTGIIGASDYTWNFGSGASPTSATGPGPHTVSYSSAGQVTVSLSLSGDVNATETKTNYINITPSVIPSVTLSANPGVEFCDGTFVTFTANATNGGANPNFEFILNGAGVQSGTSNTFATNDLGNGDELLVILTSDAICAIPDTAHSNLLELIVNFYAGPTPVYTVTEATFCSDSNIELCADIGINQGFGAFGGFNASVLWFPNGETNLCFITNVPGTYYAVLTDANGCTFTTQEITIDSINCTEIITTCNDIFYDSGGPSGNYSNNENLIWVYIPAISGNLIQADFTQFALEDGFDFLEIYDGDITLGSATFIGDYTGSNSPGIITAANPDGVLSFVFSSDFSVTNLGWAATITCVPPPCTPTVDINANPSGAICAGTSVTFTASGTDTGANPTYNFLVNGNSVQSGSSNTFTSTTLLNNDVVECVLISDADCASIVNTATSPSITLTVNANPITGNISGNSSPACNGTESYSVTLTPGSSYVWTVPAGASVVSGATGPNNNTITINFGSTNGSISVIETNSNNCTGNLETLAIILQGCGLNADFSANQTTICEGQTVVFTNQSTGTTANTDYQWNFGSNATPSTATGEGPHTVTYNGSGNSSVSLSITDGATSSVTFNDYITVLPKPTQPTVSVSNNCGNSILTMTGLTHPFSWTDGDLTNPRTVTASGTYAVFQTALGCNSDTTAVNANPIAVPSQPTISVSDNCGNSVLTISGLSHPFSWTDGNTSNPRIVTTSGTFAAFQTFSGCNSDTAFIVANPVAIPAVPVVSVTNNCGNSILTVTGLTHPFSWTDGDLTNPRTVTASGTYAVFQTNSGCNSDTTDVFAEPSSEISSINIDITDASCGANNGEISVTSVTGGTSPYTYSLDGVIFQSGNNFSLLSVGVYSVFVLDANNCSFTASATINSIGGPTAIDVSAQSSSCGFPNGNIVVNSVSGGTPGYLYSIDGGPFGFSNSFFGLTAGNYNIGVQDALGCVFSQIVSVGNLAGPSNLSFTIDDENCDLQNGSVLVNFTLGDGALFSINFDGNSSLNTLYSGLTGGSYFVSVLDANGCSINGFATVNSTPGISAITTSILDATCGLANGSLEITSVTDGTAPYEYSFDGGAFSVNNTFSSIAAGTFTIAIQDANGCSFATSVTINDTPGPVAFTTSVVDANCGSADGSIEVTSVDGGTAPYQYSIDGGVFDVNNLFASLDGGSYSITVQDANGCTVSASISVNDNGGPTAISTSILDATCGLANGSLEITSVTDGTAPYEYSFDGGAFSVNNTFSSIAAGTFTIAVQDANGCSFSTSVTINDTPGPIGFSSTVTDETCGSSNGVIEINSVNGGTAPYEYNFDGGGFTPFNSFVELTQGTYTLIVQDANNCTFSQSITINSISGPSAFDASVQIATCGDDNAIITINSVTDGTAPYQYSLNAIDYQTGNLFNNLAGNQIYTVYVEDANGCEFSDFVIVESENGPTAITTSILDATCGLANGSLEITSVTDGTAPYEYSFDGGAFSVNNTFSSIAAGTFTVAVQDANGCSFSTSVTINDTPGPVAFTTSVVDANCGSADGSIEVTSVDGGTAPYQYSIDGGVFDVNNLFASLDGGSYSITVQDANGCTVSASISVNDNGGPTAISTSILDATCGLANGSLEITSVTDGTAPYEYSFDGGAFSVNNTFSSIAAGTFTIAVQDANGCSFSTSVTINDTPGPVAFTTSVVDANCGSADGSIEVTSVSGGTAPYQYSIDGGVFDVNNLFASLDGGSYLITVQDANGCTVSASVAVNDNGGPTAITTSILDATCGLANGSLEITSVTDGTAPYEYSFDGGAFSVNNTFSSIAAGTFTVAVQDANGCSFSTSVTINDTPGPVAFTTSVVDANCGSADGSIEVTSVDGGTAPYQYSIDGGVFDVNNLFASLDGGSYSIIVQDANGCTVSASISVNDNGGPTAISTSILDATCGLANGSLEITSVTDGTAPYEYSFDGGAFSVNNTFSSIAAGTFTVAVQDANGCSFSTSVTINDTPGPVAFTTSVVDANCGSADGSIEVTSVDGGTAPYQYSIDGGVFDVNNLFASLDGGSYSITVQDANGCTVSASISVNDNGGPTAISTSILDATCGLANGSLEITSVTDGTAPYEYSFDGGAFSVNNTFSSIAAGTFTIAIQDANGCSFATSVTINDTPGPVAFTTSVVDANCGSADGSIEVTSVSGGTAPYQYSIDGGVFDVNNLFASLDGGSYLITVQDANGCTVSASVAVNDNGGPTAITTSILDATCGLANGSLEITSVTDGTAPYEYSFDGGAFSVNNTFSSIAAGTFTIAVQDANGCSFSTSVTINDTPGPVAFTTSVVDANCGSADGSIEVTSVDGGTAPYQYSIDGGVFDVNNLFASLDGGSYSIIVQDANGCTVSASISVNDNGGPTAISTSILDATCGLANGSLEITSVTDGTAPYEYSFDGGAFSVNNTFSSIAAGTFTVAVQDANGCSFSTSVTINDTPGPVAFTTSVVDANCGSADGSIEVTSVDGGTAPYQYSIDGGVFDVNNLFASLDGGSYSITVQDANGCTVSASISVNDNGGPTAISTSILDATCGLANGSLEITSVTDGTAPYEYSFDGGAFSVNNTFSSIAAGTFTIAIQDANGCSFATSVTINDTPGPVAFTTSVVDANCGSADGSIEVTSVSGGTAPYQYSIDGGVFDVNNLFASLDGGSYLITVQDANGCTVSASISVNDNGGPTAISTSILDATCGLANGSLEITSVTDGTAPYEYSFDGGAFSVNNTFSSIAAGTFTIAVQDANGCSFSTSVTINDTPGPVAFTTSVVDANCGSADGSIEVTSVSGGTAPYQYSIDGGVFDVNNLFASLDGGSYSITVQDANGCTVSASISVNDNGGPTAISTSILDATCGLANGSLEITSVTDGTAPYEYSFDGGAFSVNNTFSSIAAGTFTVAVQDANGCSFSTSVTINDTPGPVAFTTSVVDANCGSADGSIEVTSVDGGTAPYQYSIDGGVFDVNNLFASLDGGSYSITVQDANGCTVSASISVNDNGGPTAISTSILDATCGLANGSLEITSVTDGTAPYEYSFDGGAFSVNNTFSSIAAGTFTIAIQDANGCSFATSVTINDTPGPVAFTTSVVDANCGSADGSIEVTSVSGGTAPYQYSIDGGVFDVNNLFASLDGGSYSNHCSGRQWMHRECF